MPESSQNRISNYKFEEKVLAFAKNINQNNPSHPEESKNSELKEYMDY